MKLEMNLGKHSLIGKTRKDVVNPATGQVIDSIPCAEEQDVERIIEVATSTFNSWSKINVFDRSKMLDDIAQQIDNNRREIVELMISESGKTRKDCEAEVTSSIQSFHYYANLIKNETDSIIPSRNEKTMQLSHKMPYGAVALMTPWNFPFSMLTRKVAPAIAAGNTVIVKPSDKTPLIAYYLNELVNKILPEGVFNIVTGNSRLISKVILADKRIRKLSFTGSTKVGKSLYRDSSESLRKLSLELGGNAPFIVTKSADIVHAAQLLVAAKTRSNGQVCISPNRVYVHEDIYEQFKELLIHHVQSCVTGNPAESDTQLGPLINREAVERLNRTLSDASAKGASLLAQSNIEKCNRNGNFFPLTLIGDVDDTMLVYCDEIFGPIIALTKYEDIMDIIQKSNLIEYGLAAYVFTKDISFIDAVSHSLISGMIGINTVSIVSPETPFGGVRESGFGRENGVEGLHEFLEPRFVSIDYSRL